MTGITGFTISAGKVYRSPMIDCFDGIPVCRRIGVSPNTGLANGMLEDAAVKLKAGEHSIVYGGSWLPLPPAGLD